MAKPSTDSEPPLHLRLILDVDGLQECIEFQRICYSSNLSVVPRDFLVTIAGHGGLVVGAFDADEVMRGLLLSLPALCGERPCLHTYATLVEPETPIPYSTLVTCLKREERQLALRKGYEAITWYQDPFDLDNAELNLVTLGARVTGIDLAPVDSACEFRVPGPPDLSRGKLVLTWELLRHPQVRRDDAKGLVRDGNLPRVAITIPTNIQEVCAKDPDVALRWRAAILDAFDFFLSQGYSGTGERHEYEFRYLLTVRAPV